MSFSYHRFNFQDISKDVSKAAQWLQDLGLNYAQTRIGAYKRSIEELLGLLTKNKLEDINNRTPEFSNALYEACEFTIIYRALHTVELKGLRERLARLVKGPTTYTEEEIKAAGNSARNIAFELNVAARLLQAGITPFFEAVSNLIPGLIKGKGLIL